MSLKIGDVVIVPKEQTLWCSHDQGEINLLTTKYMVVERILEDGQVEARCLLRANIPILEFYLYRFPQGAYEAIRSFTLEDAQAAVAGFSNLVALLTLPAPVEVASVSKVRKTRGKKAVADV